MFAEDGSVTAGNSSQLSDGASMTLVMSLEKALELGLKPKAFFRGFTVAGCEPDEMGIGPVFSVPRLLKAKGLQVADIDLWELNEAFASQCLYARVTAWKSTMPGTTSTAARFPSGTRLA